MLPQFIHLASQPVHSPSDQLFLQRTEELIHLHLDDCTLHSGVLETELGTSRTQLYRRLKRLTGLSPNLFIRRIRLQAAQELMQTSSESITTIAYQVGFSDAAYFSRVFQRTYQISPSRWRVAIAKD